jgi:hypothetical protein
MSAWDIYYAAYNNIDLHENWYGASGGGFPYEPWDSQNTQYRSAGTTIQQHGLPHDISSGEGNTIRRRSDTVAGKYLLSPTRTKI